MAEVQHRGSIRHPRADERVQPYALLDIGISQPWPVEDPRSSSRSPRSDGPITPGRLAVSAILVGLERPRVPRAVRRNRQVVRSLGVTELRFLATGRVRRRRSPTVSAVIRRSLNRSRFAES